MKFTGSFGDWLKQRRKALDLTQRDLADQVSCAEVTIRRIEGNVGRPSKQIAERMADVLAIALDERSAFVSFARDAGRLSAPLVNSLSQLPACNVPPQSTPFIGRERELVQIAECLADPNCRLLTLLGPGGIGKTRLALQAAAGQLEHFGDGVYFVPLTPIGSTSFFVTTVAKALHISLRGEDDPMTQLVNYLYGKRLLLILDNYEHLLEGVGLLTDLLMNAPHVKLLVTSRERLNIQEEWAFPVGGMPFPPHAADGTAEYYGAVQLFVQCARRVQPGFSLDGIEKAVIQICQAVEGMPLSIELAAAWLRVLSCEAIAHEIEHSLDILESSLRNVAPRHRNIRTVFEHSWGQLSTQERSVLAAFSVFRGGCDRAAAEFVTGASLPILASLVDKSLLRLNAAGRYEMQELLRQFAADKLLDSGEAADTEQRHYEFYCTLTEQLEGRLYGPQYTFCLDRFEVEHNNFRAALDWAVRVEDATAGLRLAGALGWFWSVHNYFAEGRDWLTKLLATGQAIAIDVRAKALFHAIWILVLIGDAQGKSFAEEAVTLIPDVENTQLRAWLYVGVAFSENLESKRRWELFQEAWGLFKQIGDSWGINEMHYLLGQVAFQRGEFTRALVLLEEGTKLARQADDKRLLSKHLLMTGCALAYQGSNVERIRTLYHESLNLSQELADEWHAQLPRVTLGQLALLEQDYAQACLFFEKCLEAASKAENPWSLIFALVGMATICCTQGEPQRAARLLGAVEDSAKPWIAGSSWLNRDGRRHYERAVSAARSQLDEVTFAAEWAAGKAMTQEQAIACALEDRTTLPVSDR